MSEQKSYKLGLIGCGHMGSALLEGWLAAKSASHVTILDPADKSYDDDRITLTHDLDSFIPHLGDINALILAVKPQTLARLCDDIAPHVPEGMPVLSIAAGYAMSSFHKAFPDSQPIIRCMPNTPGAIGKGITGAYRAPNLMDSHITITETLLSALGDIIWVNDESLMDSITAVSGSGPAYAFYLIEALEEAAKGVGLNDQQAAALARQTVIGAAALADSKADIPAATLRENVTSPGGTTQAALEKLMDGRMQDVLSEAVKAAAIRSKELSQ